MTNEHEWSFEVSHSEARVGYRWREHVHDGKSYGYHGEFVVPESGQVVTAWPSQLGKRAAQAAVQAFRHEQVRELLPERDGSDMQFSLAILELYRLSVIGVYLGQFSNNQTLYVGDVASILEVDQSHALRAIESLVDDGSLGLDGFIITSNDTYEATFAYWLATTGHYRLYMADFGGWSCAACGKHGDELESPGAVKCTR